MKKKSDQSDKLEYSENKGSHFIGQNGQVNILENQNYKGSNMKTNKYEGLNKDDLEYKFNLIEEAYRKKYSSLTDEDFIRESGYFNNFTSHIASKTNRSKAEVEKEIKSWG